MSLPASDTFTTGLSNPSITTYSANWQMANSDMFIPTGQNAVYGYDLTNAFARWVADTFDADHYSQATIVGSGFSGGYFVGVGCRISGSADTGYYYYTTGSSGYLFRRNAGANTIFGASPDSVSWAIGDVIKIQAEGVGATVTLTVFKNGVSARSASDTDGARLTTAGYPGLATNGGVAATAGLDNWSANNVNVSAGRLFRTNPSGNLSGLGSSGPFFQNPLQ